jgi:transcriptional regulator with XRE-family HTH domain
MPKKPKPPRMSRSRKEVDTSTFVGRFAVRLRSLWEKRKMTVEQLAEASGITAATIYDWEKARCNPGIERLPLLAEALQIKVRTLLPEA